MKFIFIEPPKVIRLILKDFIWQNNHDEILFTFDDGPFPGVTENILNVLNSNNIKGLFFLTGKNISENLNLFDLITENGHFVANHSYSHSRKNLRMNLEDLKNEILLTENYLIRTRNFQKFFRPPYGLISYKMKKVLDDLNYKIMMWSLLTEDYLSDFEIVKKNLDKHLKKNSIIVFHNNLKSFKIIERSLYYSIDLISKRGYKIGNTFSI